MRRIALLIVIFLIFIGSFTLIIRIYNIDNENSIFSITTYMSDIVVIDKYTNDKDYFVVVNIIRESGGNNLYIKNGDIILKVNEDIYPNIILNNVEPYIGFSLQLNVNKNDLSDEMFNTLKERPETAINYEKCYKYLTLTNLFDGTSGLK